MTMVQQLQRTKGISNDSLHTCLPFRTRLRAQAINFFKRYASSLLHTNPAAIDSRRSSRLMICPHVGLHGTARRGRLHGNSRGSEGGLRLRSIF